MMRKLALIVLMSIAFQCTASDLQQSAEKLDQAIDDVIKQREYQWRMPREVVEEEEQNLLFDFLEGMANTMKKAWKPISRLWNKLRDWMRRASGSGGPDASGGVWSKGELNLLIIVLISAVALLTLLLIWKNRKTKRRKEEALHAEAVAPVPDLTDENLMADQLPLEGWQKLAQDLLGRGELRLALRAFFMATLAHLSAAGMITIARFKSNRDYLNELKRRAYDAEILQSAFDENVSAVDCVWYGKHPVTEEMLDRFLTNAEIVKRGNA